MAGFAIYDDDAVRLAAKQEIIRRYYAALCNLRKGNGNDIEVHKIELLIRQLGIDVNIDRKCVNAALDKAEATGAPAVAIELECGKIVTGKTSSLLGASAAGLLNALKAIANIPKEKDIISEHILRPIQNLKTETLGNHNPRLHTDEVLIALSVSAAYDNDAKLAIEALPKLKNIVPIPAPRAVPGPRITDSANAGTAPISTQNHLAFFG